MRGIRKIRSPFCRSRGASRRDPLSGNVVIGFYPLSLMADVAHGIQEVFGVRLVFATSEEFHPLFAGKVLDHEEGRGFFLRDP